MKIRSKVVDPEVENIRKKLRTLIKSVPDVVEDEYGKLSKGGRKIWLKVKMKEVTVEPIGYWCSSLEQVKQEEFELKDTIDGYLKYGFLSPRLTFEDKKENGRDILYCKMTGAQIKIEFRPKWFELLNGVNRMVFTEYKNAEGRRKDRMLDILKSLRKVTKRAEYRCRKLGYDV